jgi:7-carboxy-7-deazaguanine synthase
LYQQENQLEFIPEYFLMTEIRDISVQLEEGMLLPVMETFCSLQGEGYNTGKAAFFIRIGGCDVGCHWCDVKESWNPDRHPLTNTETLVNEASLYPAKAVVVTGGEPLLYNLIYLSNELRKKKITTYLETSGSSPLSGSWDWICLSPKKNSPPLPEIFNDFDWAEENAKKMNNKSKLFLQPEWSNRKKMIPIIVDYILKDPKWNISLQSHKYMNIP